MFFILGACKEDSVTIVWLVLGSVVAGSSTMFYEGILFVDVMHKVHESDVVLTYESRSTREASP